MDKLQMVQAVREIGYVQNLNQEDIEQLEDRKIDNTKMIEEINKADVFVENLFGYLTLPSQDEDAKVDKKHLIDLLALMQENIETPEKVLSNQFSELLKKQLLQRGAHEKDFDNNLTSFLTKGTVASMELDEHKPRMFNPDDQSGLIDES